MAHKRGETNWRVSVMLPCKEHKFLGGSWRSARGPEKDLMMKEFGEKSCLA